jgi:ferredoxin-NADP reductase
MSNSDAQDRFQSLLVDRVVQEARGCRSILLSVHEEIRELFCASPGQFLTIKVLVGGQRHMRCYSVSSLAAFDEALRITVKSVEDGIASRWLNEKINVGDRLMVAPPMGRFLLRSNKREAIFFAAGSGITPILPMIRHAVEIDSRRVALFYWNRNRDDAIFVHDLRGLADRFSDRFEFAELYGSRTDPNQKHNICAFASRHHGAEAYLCGPEGFMEFVRSALLVEGFTEDSIFEERFARRGDLTTPEQPVSSICAKTASITVVRDGAYHLIPADPSQVVLETMLSSGLVVPHSCKEGHCGACMVRLVKGEVERLSSSALSRRDRQRGLILACRSKPTSTELELSYDF